MDIMGKHSFTEGVSKLGWHTFPRVMEEDPLIALLPALQLGQLGGSLLSPAAPVDAPAEALAAPVVSLAKAFFYSVRRSLPPSRRLDQLSQVQNLQRCNPRFLA